MGKIQKSVFEAFDFRPVLPLAPNGSLNRLIVLGLKWGLLK